MKKLYLPIFKKPHPGEDIRDFQIEGMSVGDSLLDYFSSEENFEYHKLFQGYG